MSDGVVKSPDQRCDAESATRQPWTRPTLTRIQAADAENFTRVVAHDGQLTFS